MSEYAIMKESWPMEYLTKAPNSGDLKSRLKGLLKYNQRKYGGRGKIKLILDENDFIRAEMWVKVSAPDDFDNDFSILDRFGLTIEDCMPEFYPVELG